MLLSKRGDLNVWALPGGRLDSGESLIDGVTREVREETGLECEVVAARGLYYLAGLRRMNVLFLCHPIGGRLRPKTEETRDNRWFSHYELPAMPLRQIVEDAFENAAFQRVITTPAHELRRLRARLAVRYVLNAIRGRREPRFHEFSISAAALIGSPSGRVLSRPGRMQTLPRVRCHGETPIWQQLMDVLHTDTDVRGLRDLRWAGVWMQPERDQLEFVFTARADDINIRNAEWSAPRTGALSDRDAVYAERLRSADGVWWLIQRERSAQAGDTLVR